MATPQCSLPMTGIRDEEASYHRSTIAVLQPRYQATPILQQSVGGDRSGGLHFSSLLGAKPTSVETPKMTFLTPSVIATVNCRIAKGLFDHLVGERLYFIGNGEAEGFSGFQVYDEVEFGRLLDRDLAGLRSAQNLVDKIASALEQSRIVWSVRYESPGLDKIAVTEDRRQPRSERKRDDWRFVDENESVLRDVKCIRLGLKSLEDGRNILRAPDFEWRDFET